jgi:Transposase DDE domain
LSFVCVSCRRQAAPRLASQVAQLKEPFPDRMGVITHTIQEKRLMCKTYRSFPDALSQFLTPQLWKQVHQAWRPKQTASRWTLQPLVWVLLTMTWCCGDAEGERFATARAFYVSCQQRRRRPGASLQGFQMALARLPMAVLRALAAALRQRFAQLWLEALRIGKGGYVPLACDGSRLECPRTKELQTRLGAAGKPESPPMVYLSALVLLPLGLLWSWRLGKGDASEHHHLRCLLPTLPRRALIVADAFYQGYDLYAAILEAKASFLVRLSSRSRLYTAAGVRLERFRQTLVYYWPEKTAQDQGKPPLHLRLLRVRGAKADVWLLTNVLDPRELNHRQIAQLYRWRWRNEGLFRQYKRLLGKVKLHSRTVKLVHREAEGSLIALQLLLALATQTQTQGGTVTIQDNLQSPRRILLRIRGGIAAKLRTLGPRQFAAYQDMLERVRSEERLRFSPKVRQVWPRRKDHKPPKPPLILTMDETVKMKIAKALQAQTE